MRRIFHLVIASAISGIALHSQASAQNVESIPSSVREEFGIQSNWYTKYTDAGGIPILGSDNVSDGALLKARANVLTLLGTKPNPVSAKLRSQKVRVVIIGLSESVRDIPEYAAAFHDQALDRSLWGGFGATQYLPITAGTERNIIQNENAENVFVHEFAHSVAEMALREIDPTFSKELEEAWTTATHKKLWANTYAGSNVAEYWAEGVQSYFDVNCEGPPDGDGVHNYNNTRSELKEHDALLYRLLDRIYGEAKLRNR